MCKKNKIVYVCSLWLNFFVGVLLGVSVGSDTAVSRQTSLVTFPQVDVNNQVLGFTAIDAGFTLASRTTTCTFNAYFPVTGPITVNDGQLQLNKDLNFAVGFSFVNGAYLRGTGKAIVIPETPSDITLPTTNSVVIFDSVTLDLGSNMVLGGVWRIRGTTKIIGNGKTITLGTGNLVIEVGARSQLELQNVVLSGVGSSNVRCITSDGSIILNNCFLNLARDYTFSMGTLSFENDVVFSGTSQFTYGGSNVCSIYSASTLCFEPGVSFNYLPSAANKNLLVMYDATSALYLNGASVFSTYTGLSLQTGTLLLDNKVTFSNQARNSGEAMEFSSSLNIQALAGAVLDIFGITKYV